MATSEHGLSTPAANANLTTTTTRPAPALPKQQLTYAPDTGAKRKMVPSQTEPATPVDQTQVSQTLASNNKRQQCQALSKRVVSLERRLRSPLEPEDMDNTVVAMAKYQRSFDQHCIN